jgi:hypothetical protein
MDYDTIKIIHNNSKMTSSENCIATILDNTNCRRLKYNETDYCKAHQYILEEQKNKIDKSIVSLEQLIDKFPQIRWNYKLLSRNPNITLNYIARNPTKNWDYNFMSYNPNISAEFIKSNIDQKWNWLAISSVISLNDIINNPELPWNYTYVSTNPNVNIKFILSNLDKNWNFNHLSNNQSIKIYQILTYSNLPWNYYFIISRNDFDAKNKNIFKCLDSYFEFEEYKNEEELFSINLAENINIIKLFNSNFFRLNGMTNMRILGKLAEKFKNEISYDYITSSCQMSEILENPNIPWDYDTLSDDPELTPEIVENNKDIPWNHEILTQHPNFRMCDLKKLDICIGYRYFLNNNLSFTQIQKLDFCDIEAISSNYFDYHIKLKIINKIKKNYKIKKLKLYYKLINNFLIFDLAKIVKLYYFG